MARLITYTIVERHACVCIKPFIITCDTLNIQRQRRPPKFRPLIINYAWLKPDKQVSNYLFISHCQALFKARAKDESLVVLSKATSNSQRLKGFFSLRSRYHCQVEKT